VTQSLRCLHLSKRWPFGIRSARRLAARAESRGEAAHGRCSRQGQAQWGLGDFRPSWRSAHSGARRPWRWRSAIHSDSSGVMNSCPCPSLVLDLFLAISITLAILILMTSRQSGAA